MLDLDPTLATFAASISAAQQCGETPGEPYPWLQDNSERCTLIVDHVLVGLNHVSSNGTVW